MHQSTIRNFSIIAHIDHGKTTLTDRFLRLTRPEDRNFQDRMMDSNPIERERGITIKLAPVRMEYKGHILNLIDTPGHVDFGYEVSRSLAACEGALLVVDATQGIQAQTLSNFEKAKELGLVLIPVINKIDLPSAQTDRVILELMETFGFDDSDIVQVSAKTGLNIERVLELVIEKIPPPQGDELAPLRSLLITSHVDQHKGAIAMVRVIDGEFKKEKLAFHSNNTSFIPIEIGVFSPEMTPVGSLKTGEVGYIATGLKDVRDLKIGDTITSASGKQTIEPLPGFREPQPMVYMEIYPIDTDEFPLLQDAVSKLALRDAALQYSGCNSIALGSGLRVGFLGILHAEIVLERLKREFDLDILATSPSVTYKLRMTNGLDVIIRTPSDMPDPAEIDFIEEPIAKLVIFTPQSCMSDILTLVRERRGEFVESTYLDTRVRLVCRVPLAEIITDFHDVLKSASSGYASLEYDIDEYVKVDAVKISILLNHEPVEALSFMAVRERAESSGRKLVEKLTEVIPRQNFEVPIQATIGGSVIARATLKAYRKDVTAHLYGGDVTRRKKLLSKQAKGKKKMKKFGKVELNQDAFMAVLKR